MSSIETLIPSSSCCVEHETARSFPQCTRPENQSRHFLLFIRKKQAISLHLRDLTKTSQGRTHSGSGGGTTFHRVSPTPRRPLVGAEWKLPGRILGLRDVRDSVGTTGNGALAGPAVPDTDGVSADGDLAAEGAGVLGVLGDFHLLHLLTQGSTVAVYKMSVCVL